jgi:hypothetical protein
MINYMKDIDVSRIPHLLLEKVCKSHQSERFKARDQAALNLASIMGTLGCTKRLPTFCKTLAICPQS